MIRRLQKARAQSDRLEHQEKLLEELSSIVSQLQLKGENVDNCFLQDQLLGKFTEGIQRHVLRAKEQRSPNDNWDTNMLLSCAKEYIRTELKIVTRVGKGREQQPVHEPAGDRRYPRTGRKISRRLEREEIKRSRKRSLSHTRTREHSEGARRSSDSRSTRRDQDASRGQEKRCSSTRSMDHQHK
ncbi:hypothetical protein V3C99_016340 [Haemonchus contortus]